ISSVALTGAAGVEGVSVFFASLGKWGICNFSDECGTGAFSIKGGIWPTAGEAGFSTGFMTGSGGGRTGGLAVGAEAALASGGKIESSDETRGEIRGLTLMMPGLVSAGFDSLLTGSVDEIGNEGGTTPAFTEDAGFSVSSGLSAAGRASFEETGGKVIGVLGASVNRGSEFVFDGNRISALLNGGGREGIEIAGVPIGGALATEESITTTFPAGPFFFCSASVDAGDGSGPVSLAEGEGD
ncbi:hypothetical protein OAG63_00005, partial [Methylacidiphilales bacterium]|nr:hypothetical protein [Candidatus Methylacidiphilales bacterium]